MTQKSTKKKNESNFSIEDIYTNKNFALPNQKTFETIFEEPRISKDGVKQLTSVKKFKRFLDFDATTVKLQKRRNKVKKCVKRSLLTPSKIRSASRQLNTLNEFDVSYLIPELSDDVKSPSENVSSTKECLTLNHSKPARKRKKVFPNDCDKKTKVRLEELLSEAIESQNECTIEKQEQSISTSLRITYCSANNQSDDVHQSTELQQSGDAKELSDESSEQPDTGDTVNDDCVKRSSCAIA